MESEINDTILSVRGLRTHFRTDDGIVRAADEVSFDLRRGETLAIVGESGSGKSATAMSLLRLIEPEGGEVFFDGKDIVGLPIIPFLGLEFLPTI